MTTRLTSRDRFRRALASEPVDRPPAWMMRQAGRYLPEYRALRESHAFLECVHDAALAAELTLQPMRRFAFDAAILFSDILIALEAVGFGVKFPAGGPRIAATFSRETRLREVQPERDFAQVAKALGMARRMLGEDRALLGFAGAPFTLACYAVEGAGSKDFARTRRLMRSDPRAFDGLLARLADVVAGLLVLQARAGADAVQLFDTWGGLLGRDDYRARLAPLTRRIVESVHEAGGRIIVFVKDGTHLLDDVLDSGADCVGVDWRSCLGEAAQRCRGRAAVQGNIDPSVLFGPPEEIRRHVRQAHDAVAGSTGHVVNLGHGILPDTPVEGVTTFLEAVSDLAPQAAP